MDSYARTVSVAFYAFLTLKCFGQKPDVRVLMGNTSEAGTPAVQAIIRRAKSDPKVLRELAPLPLEQTYWPLSHIVHNNYSGLDAIRPIAREILAAHPDLEKYFSRNLRRMAELLDGISANADEREQRSIASNYIHNYIGDATMADGDGAFRLIGPLVMGPEWEYDIDDSTIRSYCYPASEYLRSLIRERLRGERVPRDLEEGRMWWKANEQRFASKPAASAEPEQPNESKPEPPPKPPKAKENPSPTTPRASVAAAPSFNDAAYWTIALLILTGAGVSFLWWRRHAK